MDQVTTNAIVEELTRVYWLEVEATINYIAISIDLDGIRAEEIKKSLATDIQAELTHAQELANRIKEIGGVEYPDRSLLNRNRHRFNRQKIPQTLFRRFMGLLRRKILPCDQYNKIIRMCDGIDYVTQDLCIKLLADEEKHRREFIGFLKEFEKE